MPIKAYWSGGPKDPLGDEPTNPGVKRYEEQQRLSGPQHVVMRKWDYDRSGMLTAHLRIFKDTAEATAAGTDAAGDSCWFPGALILVWDGTGTPELYVYTSGGTPWVKLA